ncbi:MAG: NADH-quinone oxidoreductase subunit NuoK [Armatimonadetes bacterium]|nr:NADH-quinone oxidoreductase subunit NuoK [Armatimonadota bacterium]
MQGVPLFAYIALALFMFTVGTVGVIIRRNPIVIFMCVELMLNAVNLTFLAFARYMPAMALQHNAAQRAQSQMAGQMMVIFVMAVAAAEVAVGLGIIMAIYRLRENIDIDELNLLKG